MKTKKFVSMLLVLTTLIHLNARFYTYALTANSLKSAYINKNSWLIKELEEKMEAEEEASEDGDWKEKVVAIYKCVDGEFPASGDMVDILKKDDMVALSIPMGEDSLLGKGTELGAAVKFSKPVSDVEKVLNSDKLEEGLQCEIELYNLVNSTDKYMDEIKKIEEVVAKDKSTTEDERDPTLKDFDFENDVRIYAVTIKRYTYGFILVDKDDKKLFWCRKTVREFEKNKLYKLKDVLDAHATFARNLAEMLSGHRGWF
ncbi:MAG: hypothetical protein IJC97_00820 [Oscillospiraceae bacterium]|nr:hypothetical protein [Oscillospiraceae bacterium]